MWRVLGLRILHRGHQESITKFFTKLPKMSFFVEENALLKKEFSTFLDSRTYKANHSKVYKADYLLPLGAI